MSEDRHGYTVRIPQDVSRPDKVLFGATARQAVILGGTAAGLWLIWLAVRDLVPPLLFIAPALLVLLLLGIAVTAEHDGIGVDRLLFAAALQTLSPCRRVMAPGGVTAPPAFLAEALRGQDIACPSPLDLPVQGVGPDGVVDLGGDGVAVLASASTVNFALRTPVEQELLVAGFAGWLNALTGPVQITSRAAPADLTAQIGELRADASALPHPLLESAALGHADFLTEIGETGCLLHRTVLITAREPDPAHAARAARRIANAAAALSSAEVDAAPLSAAGAHRVLSTALDPDARDLIGA
jgi:hypothetical protein